MPDYILSPDEIIQLAREYENVRRWEGVRDFVFTLFGAQAAYATLTIVSVYNDSSCDDEIEITVLDKNGQPLGYDWNSPWWHQFPLTYEEFINAYQQEPQSEEYQHDFWVSKELTFSQDLQQEITNALQTLLVQTVGIELVANGRDHDPIAFTFQLDTPPPVRFPLVYAVLSDEA